MSRITGMTPRERELQDEVDRLRDDRERTEDRERHALQERRQAQIEDHEAEFRTATDWPEALVKQRSLFQHEAREEIRDGDPDQYFTIGIQVVDKALELWGQVRAERQDEISEIKQRLERIEGEIRLEVAQRLEQAGRHAQYYDIAFGIRDNDIANFLNW